MRLSIVIPCLLMFVSSGSWSAVRAAEEVESRITISSELVAAQHSLLLARRQAHDYQFVTLPAARRALDEHKRLATLEIQILRGRLYDYRPFLRVGEYSPVRTAAESHLLSLVAVEGRLRTLRDDRIALMRSSRQQQRLYSLEVLHAAAQLAEIRREQSIEPH
jgi:hypothetical protein